jgi:hypothetical protein
MNLKELINLYQGRVDNEYGYVKARKILAEVLEDLKSLDKPTKVEIPAFADAVIKMAKSEGFTLFWAMDGKGKTESFRDWIEKPENQETFARAWNEGYKVEEEEGKEKRYLVKLKATNQYLHVDSFNKASFLPLSISSFGTEVTKAMLDDLGLSEAFSNPLFEVEEVK